jgi:protein-S-isoprenylcysteine O-methyltransferase Ste14
VVQVLALIGFASGQALVLWAMRVNRFFSPVVRIQSERGHGVVAAGPYRHVRHPDYLGGLVCLVCGGLALGSGWAMAPLGLCVLMILRRTALEDRFLHEQLPGYPDFAERVRHRLLPGLW